MKDFLKSLSAYLMYNMPHIMMYMRPHLFDKVVYGTCLT